MAKTYRCVIHQQDSCVNTFFEHCGTRFNAFVNQPQFGLCRHDRNQFHNGPSSWCQTCEPGEHRIADTLRHSWILAGQRFGHEEGIATCNCVKIIHPFARASGEFINCVFRKRWETKSSHERTR